MQSLEQTLAEHTVALRELTAAIIANTAKMTELTGTAAPANVVPITKPAKVKPAAKETPAPVVEETPEPEKEAPVEEVEVVTEPDAPVESAKETAEADDAYLSWDEPTLRLASQEYFKLKLVAPDSKAFKDAFTAELAANGVEKAAKLTFEQLQSFYSKALTW